MNCDHHFWTSFKRDTCENRVRVWFLTSYSEPHSVPRGTALQYPKRQPCWSSPLLMSLLFTASTFSTTLQPLLSLFLYFSCPYSSRCLLHRHTSILPCLYPLTCTCTLHHCTVHPVHHCTVHPVHHCTVHPVHYCSKTLWNRWKIGFSRYK
jgi:hypothetical protein